MEDVEKERKLALRDAFPSKWASSLFGKIAQVILFPLIVAFTLMAIYIVSPIANIVRMKNAGKDSIATGRSISDLNTGHLAENCKASVLSELWSEHGLSERISTVTDITRGECLERWLDALYGKGIAVVSRVRPRLREKLDQRAGAKASSAVSGISISQTDAVDELVQELSTELPSFR
jgi:hypothetical protein